MDRRKELKEMYKNSRPDMGVLIIRSNSSDKCYIEGTQDLKGTINGIKFKLNAGMHPNKNLQTAWKEKGESGFTIEILEKLKYDTEEGKTNYSEELNIIKMIWEDKLCKREMKFY